MKEEGIPAMTSRSLASLSLRQGILQRDKAYKVMEGITMNSIVHILVSFLGYVIKSLSIPISFSFSKKITPKLSTYLPSPQTLPYPYFPPFPNFWKEKYISGISTTLWYIPKLSLMLSGFLTVQSIASWVYRCCYNEFSSFLITVSL